MLRCGLERGAGWLRSVCRPACALWSDICQLVIILYEPGMEKRYLNSVDHEPSDIYPFSRFLIVWGGVGIGVFWVFCVWWFFFFLTHPSPLLCLHGLLSFQPHPCFDFREVSCSHPLVSHLALPDPAKLRPSRMKREVGSSEKDLSCSGSTRAPWQVRCDTAESLS